MESIRSARQSEVERIANLWHAGWHDAHALIVPQQLTKLRTLESFVQRTHSHLHNIRVAGNTRIRGLCVTREDELFQLYILQDVYGTGLAKMLLDDAERQMLSRGISQAWLVCAVGNERAAKFYQKCGWQLEQTAIHGLETVDGVFPLEVWKFEKNLVF